MLEATNIKLASVATDITGKSGRAILHALLSGEENPEVLAELVRGRMRGKREELAQAVQGTLGEHHRFSTVEPAAPVGLLRPTNRGVRSGDCPTLGRADRFGRPRAAGRAGQWQAYFVGWLGAGRRPRPCNALSPAIIGPGTQPGRDVAYPG